MSALLTGRLQGLAMATRARLDQLAAQFANFHGVPPGGSDAQVLTKDGNSDYSLTWADIPAPAISGPAILSKTADYSVTATDGETIILCNGTFTLSLPTAVGNEAKITAKVISGSVTVDPAASETIDGGSTAVVPASASISIVSDGVNWAIV